MFRPHEKPSKRWVQNWNFDVIQTLNSFQLKVVNFGYTYFTVLRQYLKWASNLKLRLTYRSRFYSYLNFCDCTIVEFIQWKHMPLSRQLHFKHNESVSRLGMSRKSSFKILNSKITPLKNIFMLILMFNHSQE